LCSTPYSPGREHGVHPLDPDIGIEWPAGTAPVLSAKDAAAPTLAEARRAGLLPGYADCAAYLDGRRAENSLSGPVRGEQSGKGAAQRGPPVTDRRDPGLGPGTVAKHAVGGPRGRPGQRAA
jgi:dTDP-4-dehydrorhamnose 3,5-epimerase